MIEYGDGVYLDAINKGDLSQMRLWRNNANVRQWCRQVGLISESDQLEWYERQRQDKSIRMFAIHAWSTQDFVGVCGLTSIDHINSRAEFSLYIGPEHQRRGYAKAALKTLVSFGFRELGLNSIWGETFDANPAAKLFESLGFKHEGTRREFYFKDGKFIDAHLYSVLNEEWN